jgi:hypothetical protein
MIVFLDELRFLGGEVERFLGGEYLAVELKVGLSSLLAGEASLLPENVS